ncbi:hypothetical protein D3C87_1778090 [compost metagenome]
MSVARACAFFSSIDSRSSRSCISLKLAASAPISSSAVQSTRWREPKRRVASMAAVRRISGRMTVKRLPMRAAAKTVATAISRMARIASSSLLNCDSRPGVGARTSRLPISLRPSIES